MVLVLLWKYLYLNIWNPDLDLTLFKCFALSQTQPFSGQSWLKLNYSGFNLDLDSNWSGLYGQEIIKLPLYDSSR